MTDILTATRATKRYFTVPDAVDLNLRRGEVHALFGEKRRGQVHWPGFGIASFFSALVIIRNAPE